jgi:hypothetical protein
MTPLSALTMAEKYLRTARELSSMIVRSGNRSSLSSSRKLSPAEVDRRTRRSDTNLGPPLLFNFYHGIELCLKGHALGQKLKTSKTHNISSLLSALQATSHNCALLKELNSWIPPPASSTIGKFLTNNSITIDDWYQALKYPSFTNGQQIDHFGLKYGGASALKFWKSLEVSSTVLIRESVLCARASGYA